MVFNFPLVKKNGIVQFLYKLSGFFEDDIKEACKDDIR